MKNSKIVDIISSTLDKDTLSFLLESLKVEDADRGIHETWGGRAVSAYETIKKLYIELNKEM